MTPTVDLYIETRGGYGNNWNWVPFSTGPCPEPIYTRGELLKIITTYGVWVSRMTKGAALRITVQGRFSGRWCAEAQWVNYAPYGDPWVHWPAWDNLCFAAQLVVPRYFEHDDHRLIDTGGTDVSTLRLTLDL